MNLSQVFARARAARVAQSYPEQLVLWLDEGEDSETREQAEIAAGRAGPTTQFMFVRWLREGGPSDRQNFRGPQFSSSP
jgi:hypothetical protein